MAIFHNITTKGIGLRVSTGSRIFIGAGAEVEIRHPRLIRKARQDNRLEEKATISRSNHLPEPKTGRKPVRKLPKEAKIKEKVKPPRSVIDKIDKVINKKKDPKPKKSKKDPKPKKSKPKSLKKPKGLRGL